MVLLVMMISEMLLRCFKKKELLKMKAHQTKKKNKKRVMRVLKIQVKKRRIKRRIKEENETLSSH